MTHAPEPGERKGEIGPVTTAATTGAGGAAAAVVIIVWLVNLIWGVEVPQEVAGAATVLVAIAGGLIGGKRVIPED